MQVKLTSTRFAQFISWLSVRCNMTFDMDEVAAMESALIFDVPEQKVSEEAVCELLKQINAPDGFILAIKAYRVLTGVGLKEAKEAIEKYLGSTISGKFFSKHQLMSKLKAEKIEDDASYYAVERFIESLFK